MGILAQEGFRMTNLPASNLSFLESEFNDIIQFTQENDQTGKSSSMLAQRRTFKFKDGSSLSITEILRNGNIDYYQCDWSINEKILLKVHSEPHKDTSYQTETEPYHIHVKGLLADERISNPTLKDLYSVLQLIRFFIMVVKNYI